MNRNLLINALVRQTVVLIAELVVSGPRARLYPIADEIFMNLTEALREEGLSAKIVADMFGLTVRGYRNKVKKLAGGSGAQRATMWEDVYSYIQDNKVISRDDILDKFGENNEELVKSLLADMVRHQFVYKTGERRGTRYRAVPSEDIEDPVATSAMMIWVQIFRDKPLTRDEIYSKLPVEPDTIDEALESLVSSGRVMFDEENDAYTCDATVIDFGDPDGWEAAIFDHYQAVINTLCNKLRAGRSRAARDDTIGGSTYTIGLSEDHPMKEEVLGLLQETRRQAGELRTRVAEYNAEHGVEETGKVVFYAGQNVLWDDAEEMQ